MTIHRHKFHGDPTRFEVIADFVLDRYGKKIKHIADVAGGQGMLSRMLNKIFCFRAPRDAAFSFGNFRVRIVARALELKSNL